MKPLRILLVAVLVGSAVALVACLEPTQIEMTLRTDVPYQPGRTVAIAVSKDGITDATAPATTAEDAWETDGKIGTLVLLPSKDRDEPVSVRVVMGLGRDPSTCTLADARGCIFARRRLAFVPHEPLALPVTLFAACEGVPCDENSTCTALGQCVSSTLDPATCADGKICDLDEGAAPDQDAATSSSSSGDASASSSSSGSASSSSSGGPTSSSSSSASSSSGAAPLCDPTDVTIDKSGFFSFGNVTNNATINNGASFVITLDAAGESATLDRDISTPNQICPLHFAVDIDQFVIDAVSGKVGIMTVKRKVGGDLVLEVTNQGSNSYSMDFKGSAKAYKWVGATHVGVVEMVVPLDPADVSPPRLIVAGIETPFGDLAAPAAPITAPTLEFGLIGDLSHVGYQSVHYFFAP